MKKDGIESYQHKKATRPNNPQAGQIKFTDDSVVGSHQYKHDPHIDPELSWSGKFENLSFDVNTVSIHTHERIDPKTIIEAMQKGTFKSRLPLFSAVDVDVPDWKSANEFYSHKNNWSNRLIAGDSLLVMNSLLVKEHLAGKVQTIYIDPPYGINYKSNWQAKTGSTNVENVDSDFTSEPEQIRAFRDTWELGIHSYLTYMRDRLLLSRELLTDRGSCFVQIGRENVHLIDILMSEVFGVENKVTTITYATSGGVKSNTLPRAANYLIWYAKNKENVKYHQLFEKLDRKETIEHFSSYAGVELPNGKTRDLTSEERQNPDKFLPKDAKIYRRLPLESDKNNNPERNKPFKWDNKMHQPKNGSWRVSHEALEHLAKIGRLEAKGSLAWKKYEHEMPGRQINDIWHDPQSVSNKVYVVQTDRKTIERAILMTTDPGDLVFDPTCGSGTTAYVSEKWGRRWITCDTSRISINIAKERLMSAYYDYYKLSNPGEGVDSGLVYQSVTKVSAAILGNNEPVSETVLYDQPLKDSSKNRVTGPFTVDAVPSISVKSIDEIVDEGDVEDSNSVIDKTFSKSMGNETYYDWIDQLLKSGIRGKQGEKIEFTRLEPATGNRWLHVEGETTNSKRVVISFGPDSAPLSQTQFENALDESISLYPKPDIIVFAAFYFDPEAAKRIDEQKSKITMLKIKMSEDLLTKDLKKNSKSDDLFWLIGQPEIQLNKKGNKYTVSVHGFDYYNPATGTLESGNADKIVMWMVDTDYDGNSIFPTQVYFPMAGEESDWMRLLTKNLKAEIDSNEIMKICGTESFSFEPGERKKIAVKIIDDRGIESFIIKEIEGEE